MPRSAVAAAKKIVRAPKAHKIAEEFPPGTVLQDLLKKQWQLINVIGQGGFGLIYLASDDATKQSGQKSANYVVKIEPKDNGPLYCEMHFYQRVAKPNLIQTFITVHKLRYLGVPPYVGTGRHMFNGKEFRFLVMPRLGTDLQKYLMKSGGLFSPKIVFGIGLRMLDALQYLHENEYVHADVKAANILTGFRKGSEVVNEIYLVDYGLAYRYTVDGLHKEYKEDPRKAHDGTIEFTSRDAHKGVAPSRRADLEILGYCMLQWLCGKLPWEDNLSDPSYVAHKKERLMSNPQLLIAACLPGPKTPSLECMCKYMEKVNALKYDSAPDYTSFRTLLLAAANKGGLKDEWKLDLGAVTETDTRQIKGSKRESHEDVSPVKAKKKKSSDTAPSTSQERKTKAKVVKRSPKKKASPRAPPALSTKAAHTPPSNGHARAILNKKKTFPMPPKTKATVSKESTDPKKTTRRRVRRVAAVQSDMCVQTSPGLLNNR